MVFTVTELHNIENHLTSHNFLSGKEKPNKIDANIFSELRGIIFINNFLFYFLSFLINLLF